MSDYLWLVSDRVQMVCSVLAVIGTLGFAVTSIATANRWGSLRDQEKRALRLALLGVGGFVCVTGPAALLLPTPLGMQGVGHVWQLEEQLADARERLKVCRGGNP